MESVSELGNWWILKRTYWILGLIFTRSRFKEIVLIFGPGIQTNEDLPYFPPLFMLNNNKTNFRDGTVLKTSHVLKIHMYKITFTYKSIEHLSI